MSVETDVTFNESTQPFSIVCFALPYIRKKIKQQRWFLTPKVTLSFSKLLWYEKPIPSNCKPWLGTQSKWKIRKTCAYFLTLHQQHCLIHNGVKVINKKEKLIRWIYFSQKKNDVNKNIFQRFQTTRPWRFGIYICLPNTQKKKKIA